MLNESTYLTIYIIPQKSEKVKQTGDYYIMNTNKTALAIEPLTIELECISATLSAYMVGVAEEIVLTPEVLHNYLYGVQLRALAVVKYLRQLFVCHGDRPLTCLFISVLSLLL